MPFALLLMQLLQYLPTIVQTVQAVHGADAPGTTKLATAVSLVTAAEPALAAHIEDPTKKARLEGTISAVADAMKLAGKINALVHPSGDPHAGVGPGG